uniref:Pyrin domain-containing protein n=1 Tax=Sarcophilus harrisii TaxID=9305 RepID=A0A7N4PA19_SARHA
FHLTSSLDELVEHELRKFKRKLYHIALKKCYKPIPWGKLEPAHCDDLAQMLVKYYGEKYALEVTLKVLKAIHQQDVADICHQLAVPFCHPSTLTNSHLFLGLDTVQKTSCLPGVETLLGT